jgi:hypothetical protein
MTPWPRLSETLPHPRDLRCCQACGSDILASLIPVDGPKETAPYTQPVVAVPGLDIWQEHDEADQPEHIYVVLCDPCAARLIEPHPRLYRRLDRWEPAPGIMPACRDCVHRKGLACGNPLLKANGGPGLPINAPIEGEGFACTRGKGCRWFVQYAHAPECKGWRAKKEVARP